ncbi:hypothetical protein QDA01_gp75 [Microbacterium phage Cinna]|jgi:hypothetical protein|uniref:Uncharacterized protein n=3 Tax=Mementomorivirus TaxID=2733194 RepID=A0A6B9LGX8_9CAUD|nr:hypothetical protein HOT41_gp78 [Microbacterium phage MementoMori]YP_010750941.1 hypothetical protein QDA00_gp79 [Microbacterium phage Matzah]YP_010751037.1 hypothetical protein QDA01_gp75 [Microbacterium phage Cinna]AWY05285.1 hypothetical protein SEA_MEMENTOMORI_31 [Microbacterium phage MementoMori]QDH91614.1 hypothetical protein PBI_CINNA_30 [Microbacterium phage Cinna]QHB37024.1 hypothetical protein SEA_MATZAH_31 [Microbacterium phage Matzah]
MERFCNFVWWLWTRNGDEKDKAKFKARLWQPPKGQAVTDRRSPWSPENESKAFGALQSALGLQKPKDAPKATDSRVIPVRKPGSPVT